MDFFKKTWVKVIAWVMLAVSVVVLLLGGFGVDVINTGITLTAAIVTAITALIAFICERVKK